MVSWYDTVARDAGYNVTTVSAKDFVEHLLPKVCCLEGTATRVVEKIKTEEDVWSDGWWEAFNKFPSEYKSRPAVVYQKLSQISDAIWVAVSECDPTLACRQQAQHIVVPKKSANPMNYFFFNDSKSLDGPNPYWMDIAATGEFRNVAEEDAVKWVRNKSQSRYTLTEYCIDRRANHRINGNYIRFRPSENAGVRVHHRGSPVSHVVRNSVRYVRFRV